MSIPNSKDFPYQIRWNSAVYQDGMTIEQLVDEADLKGEKASLATYSDINSKYIFSQLPLLQ